MIRSSCPLGERDQEGEALTASSLFHPVSGGAIAGAAPNTVSILLTVAVGAAGPQFATAYFVRADVSLNDLKGQMVCQVAKTPHRADVTQARLSGHRTLSSSSIVLFSTPFQRRGSSSTDYQRSLADEVIQ